MIESLLIVPSSDVYNVIEPITKQILITSVDHGFAADWALGFLDMVKSLVTGKSTEFVQYENPVAFLFGQTAANDAYKHLQEKLTNGDVR
jgi:hypothetical protein